MQVIDDDIQTVLLRVFSDLRIPAGGKIRHATLVAQWQQFRFRAQDFTRALAGLIRSGAVSTENGVDELILVLTPEGFQRAQQAPVRAGGRWLSELRLAWLALRRGRSTDAYPLRTATLRRRRASDRKDARRSS